MKVYRYASQKELNCILSGDITNIGRRFSKTRCNTHNYDSKSKYLHFFKKFESISEMRILTSDTDEEYYICEYDIPMLVLMCGRGAGYYKPTGYKYGDYSKHIEYIVPTTKFKPEWLKSYSLDDTIKKCN